jgi:crotonobetainyl-CoA:carnitine CoA-transferase CaiB-like acyl-CoA transferase
MSYWPRFRWALLPRLDQIYNGQVAFDLIRNTQVLDLSTGIAGPYASKLLADAGADVVKLESASGDPTRRWSASDTDLEGRDGALFRFLNAGKRSVLGHPSEPEARTLIDRADLVFESGELSLEDIAQVRRVNPGLVVVSITPFGKRGPWADRPATEFTLQAECGGMASRGVPEREPLQIGGRFGEWVAGACSGVAAAAALYRSRRTGAGDHVDVSMLECMCSLMGGRQPLSGSLGAWSGSGPVRSLEMPSIEPTSDGYVGICCNTGQQFRDFLVMIERSDLLDDAELASFAGRWARRDEFWRMVRDWTTKHASEEIVELANLMRIPATRVGQPGGLTSFDHFVDRGVFARSSEGDAEVPRVPYQVDGTEARPDHPAPRLGEHSGHIDWRARHREGLASNQAGLPFGGLRVVDFTSFWAGPSATKVLAALGAEVVHVESVQHPDGYRFVTMRSSALPPKWWEHSVGFQQENLNKKGVTLDVGQPEGRDLLLRLVEHADVFVENYAPRVLQNFGITTDLLKKRNPSAVIVRMPAFGLTGPWRDRTGFASTMEALTGLAWLTGYEDGPPVTLRGPLDPMSGMHACFALISALVHRSATGTGHVIECPMVEVALNVAAELQIEYSAYGAKLTRAGNRGPFAAPQGAYRCRGEDDWLALAVATDAQWDGLCRAIGKPEWAEEQAFGDGAGRRSAHDEIDRGIASWAADQDLLAAVDLLLKHGVPAAPVVDGLELLSNPQLSARGYFEAIDSELLGQHRVASLPFRLDSYEEGWVRGPAPHLGQHNRQVLSEWLGVDDSELVALEERRVIGTQPLGT